ncbi:GNAT family N-acetyltransferase [Labedella endophytica]|uniref:N-acetyltransferase n=1 Tax=Labedella endophytica TaxID=1523160 RepID=A0A433JTZ1_9MICO|nr:GNAT family protein [Labedella endophytica]RUR01567.1 N-acetyltransferase [Labedella endophytica]
MNAQRPEPKSLRGRTVVLSPLARADLPELYSAIGRPEVFAAGYGGGPAGLPADAEAFATFAESYYPWATGIPFLVSVPRDGGRVVVGTSSLADLDTVNRGAHIGWTAYDPRVWATSVNVECKLLLLDLAFSHGFERVKLQADAVNTRSRAAILKLGATFEGILRHDRVRANGSWRDTAMYSILSEEWPAVRAGLESRLAADDRALPLS